MGWVCRRGNSKRVVVLSLRAQGSTSSRGHVDLRDSLASARNVWPHACARPSVPSGFMIISHSNRFIYIKAAKVAGSSIESMLWESCGPDDVRAHMDLNGFDERFEGQNLPAPGLGPHAEPGEIREAAGEEAWRGYHKIVCIKIVCIRNPWDTLVSLFWMRMGKKPSVHCRFEAWREQGCRTPFEDFVQWVKASRGKPFLYSNGRFHFWQDGTLVADTYLRFEHLQDDYIQLCRRRHLRPAAMRRFKARFRNDDGTHYSYYYDRESADMTAEHCPLEMRYFGYGFEPRADCAAVREMVE